MGTDHQAFHTCKEFVQLPEGFTKIRSISPGIKGDISEYNWCRQGKDERVAVKQFRNIHFGRDGTVANERQAHFGNPLPQNVASPEDPLTEIAVLSYLAKQPDLSANLLRLRGIFADVAEPVTWLVTELAEGGELFTVAASETRVLEADARRYAQEVLGAVSYLHKHRIAHRDVSLENILLKDGVVKLMVRNGSSKSLSHRRSGVTILPPCR